jgi:nicotinamide riboside transporter PnuC
MFQVSVSIFQVPPSSILIDPQKPLISTGPQLAPLAVVLHDPVTHMAMALMLRGESESTVLVVLLNCVVVANPATATSKRIFMVSSWSLKVYFAGLWNAASASRSCGSGVFACWAKEFANRDES